MWLPLTFWNLPASCWKQVLQLQMKDNASENTIIVLGGKEVDYSQPNKSIEGKHTKPPRSTSFVWKAFHCTTDNVTHAHCNLCDYSCDCGHSTGTNLMKQHLKAHHAIVMDRIKPPTIAAVSEKLVCCALIPAASTAA